MLRFEMADKNPGLAVCQSNLFAVALVPLALASAVPSSKKVDYNGFKSLRVTLPKGSEDDLAAINKLPERV